MSSSSIGNIPIITIEQINIAEAWEESVAYIFLYGCNVPTQYDKPNSPVSLDSTISICITDPLSEPMIHRSFPAGLKGLQKYTMDLLYGLNDEIAIKAGTYTYHNRLTSYDGNTICKNEHIDQIESICQILTTTPYSRRAQAITWIPFKDLNTSEPPCLQSIWCRIINKTLNMNVRFRSQDAFKAAFMNIYALVRLQEYIAKRVSFLSGAEIKVGRYFHVADSYHIYGDDIEAVKNFIHICNTRKLEARTWNYCDLKYKMEQYEREINEEYKK
jgi:thymidylate synthase